MNLQRPSAQIILVGAIFALLPFNLALAARLPNADCQGDQSDRRKYDKSGSTDWATIADRDALRQRKVVAQIKAHRVRTRNDFYCSSLILLHAGDEKNLKLSYSLAIQGILHFPDEPKFIKLSALAWDRLMMARQQPQWFGTQFEKFGPKTEVFRLYPLADGVMSEAERVKLGGQSTAQIAAELQSLNASFPSAPSETQSTASGQNPGATGMRFELKVDEALLVAALEADASLATFLSLAKQTGFLAKTTDDGVMRGRRIFLARSKEALRPYFDGAVSTFPRPEGSATPVTGSGAEYTLEPEIDGLRRMTIGIDDNVQAAATVVIRPSRHFELMLQQHGPAELTVKSLGASPSR